MSDPGAPQHQPEEPSPAQESVVSPGDAATGGGGGLPLAAVPPRGAPRTDLDRIYETRFDDRQSDEKQRVWLEVTNYIARFMDLSRPVLDVATDRGYFINNLKARERWATDIRDVSGHLDPDVRFVPADAVAMSNAALPAGHFGTVFMSNYLEHLASSDVVIEQLRQAFGACGSGGRVVILQPNIRLVGGSYWDFIDHRTPLTDRSLVEACEIAGFRTIKVIRRFLPFTTKGRLPRRPGLVRLYLRCPPVWLVLGKQTLYIGAKP